MYSDLLHLVMDLGGTLGAEEPPSVQPQGIQKTMKMYQYISILAKVLATFTLYKISQSIPTF